MFLWATSWAQLNGNWWAENWLTLMLGVGGIIATFLGIYIGYLLGRKDKCPCYKVRSNNLVKGLTQKISELEIHYHGHGAPVENVTVTRILLWNSGRDPIKASDVVKAEPITVRMKNPCTILSATLVYQQEPSNQFEITRRQDKTAATVSFNHMGYMEGVIVQVVHTGMSNNDLELTGRIIGPGELKKISPPEGWKKRLRDNSWILFVIGFLVAFPIMRIEESLGIPRELVADVGFPSMFLFVLIWILLSSLVAKMRGPTLLDRFQENF